MSEIIKLSSNNNDDSAITTKFVENAGISTINIDADDVNLNGKTVSSAFDILKTDVNNLTAKVDMNKEEFEGFKNFVLSSKYDFEELIIDIMTKDRIYKYKQKIFKRNIYITFSILSIAIIGLYLLVLL